MEFAEEQLADETFPPDAQSRRVLSAIGWAGLGVPAFSQVVDSLGESGAAETAVTRALKVLVGTKRVVAVDLEPLADVVHVGGWWNRNNNPELDVVAARDAKGRNIAAVGTVKWRENTPITRNDVATLHNARTVVPSAADALLLGVCPAGAHPDAGLGLALSAHQLLTAWAPADPSGLARPARASSSRRRPRAMEPG